MNKLTKATIAGAAGIALLLGGAGSFALWSSSDTVDAGVIHSGVLTLNAPNDGSWSNVTPGHAATDITADVQAGTFKMVPGDVLQYTQDLNVTASGNDLTGTLTIDPSSIGAYSLGLLVQPTVAVNTSVGDAVVTTTNNPLVVKVTPGATAASTLQVVATLTLPDLTGTTGQNTTLDLSHLKFVLSQDDYNTTD